MGLNRQHGMHYLYKGVFWLLFVGVGLFVAFSWNEYKIETPIQSVDSGRGVKQNILSGSENSEAVPAQGFTEFLQRLKQTPSVKEGETADIAGDQVNVVADSRTETYQQLLESFNRVEGEEKVVLLQTLWRMAPEAGIDEQLLTLLQIATYDPDKQVETMARDMLLDLTNFTQGKISPAQQLVADISRLNNDELQLSELTTEGMEAESRGGIESYDIEQQKRAKLAALKEMIQVSESQDTKDYLLNSLLKIDSDSGLDIVQQQLTASRERDDRIKAIERLSSNIGDADSRRIQQILESVTYDYDEVVVEKAQQTLAILNAYVDSM